VTTGRAAASLAAASLVAVSVFVLPPLAAALVACAAVAGSLLLVPAAPEPARAAVSAPVVPTVPDELVVLIDRFSEGVLLLDAQQTVIAANGAAARILGRPRDDMVGVSLIRASRDAALLNVLREASGSPHEIAIGEQVLLATASFVDGPSVSCVLTLQDVSALRRAERARQELIGNISHELRTPIAAARALAETLESGVEEDAQRARFHAQLTSEIERLGSIVDRLLRLSRIESGADEMRLTPVSVRDLAEEALRRIEPVAVLKSVVIDVESVQPLIVLADRERILEVLANLLGNAIRHSPAGARVRVGAREAGTMARMFVSDQGPGILPRDRSRVFERFYTGDRSRGNDVGTGLGLAIARHIVSRHGGEIWVSDETPGATLCFTLPLKGGTVEEPVPTASPAGDV